MYRVKQVAEAWKQLETKYKGKKARSKKLEGSSVNYKLSYYYLGYV